MRLMVFGSCFVICSFLLHNIDAQNKRNQRPKDLENGSEERYLKYKKEDNRKKFKYQIDDNGKENYKANKFDKNNCNGKNCDKSKTRKYDNSDLTKDKKYVKYTKKFTEDSEEQPNYKSKRNTFNNNDKEKKEGSGRNYEYKRKPKKDINKDENEDSSEIDTRRKKLNGNNNKKKELKPTRGDTEYTSKGKISERIVKESNKKININSDEDSEENSEEVPKLKANRNIKRATFSDNDESEEELPDINKNKRINPNKNKKIVPPDDDSDEDTDDDSESDSSEETDERDETDEVFTGTCSKKSNCPEESITDNEDSDESNQKSNKHFNKQKIKYSIKFAHEKQKNLPSEDDNFMKKIHRGKKYKHDDDDDDDSSEEHGHPKRIHYLEEDDE